jgi:hypothetical protein
MPVCICPGLSDSYISKDAMQLRLIWRWPLCGEEWWRREDAILDGRDWD